MNPQLNHAERFANAVRWRSKRLWRRSVGKKGYQRRLAETAAKPSLARVAELATADATPDELARAGSMLDVLLAATERPSRTTLGLTAEHAILSIEAGADVSAATERTRAEAVRCGVPAVFAATRLINYLRDSQHFPDAIGLASDLFDQTGLSNYALVSHALQLRKGATDDAKRTVEALASRPGAPYGLPSLLRADQRMHSDQFDTALTELEAVKPSYGQAHSRRRVRAYMALGQPQHVLDFLETFHAEMPAAERAAYRFDAFFALGQREDAELELTHVDPADADERTIDRIAKAHGRRAAQDYLDQLAESLDVSADDPDQLEEGGIIFFRSNRPADAVHLLRRSDELRPLKPVARQALAQSLYSLRSFEQAYSEAERLRGTERHWAGMKLQGRILIQLGRADDALENRLRHSRPGDDSDQVHYHALLSLGRYSEAFRLHPFVADLRGLRADFGSRAEAHPVDRVGRRFIVADAGPGDELQDASLFGELLEMSDELVTTCDPRLHTLLARSCPQVQFIPVERLRDPPHFASHAPDAEPRSGRALDRLLTKKADQIAATCDRVVLGRAVKNARDLTDGPRPAEAFIVADEGLVQRHRPRLAGPLPTIGMVWRSELQTSWRAIHYLDASELAPLAALSARFVCLQHDATPEERETLIAVFGDRMLFCDDIDLRNDFEETAALVTALDVTIGVGTTMTNLSAAVGTPTLMLQTTHFGSWLATDDRGTDFWYAACHVLVADPPYDTSALVAHAVETARGLISDPPTRHSANKSQITP